MISPWHQLSDRERPVFSATVSFLSKRLAERETIEWALKLKPSQRIERLAIRYLLDDPGAHAIAEPWATSWRLIDESWSNAPVEQGPSIEVHRIGRRLATGDRSGALVSEIATLVTPRLEVKPIGAWRLEFEKRPRKPKTFNDLLSVSLTSGQLVDLRVLGLEKIEQIEFLIELGYALEGAVNYGLSAAQRTGWTDANSRLLVGSPNRVYYTQVSRKNADGEEPDAYSRGIAPSVKLLHAVVSRIAELNKNAALRFTRSWRVSSSLLDKRLWAAIARNPRLVSAEEVGGFLRELDDSQFWNLSSFPEIAELRAERFSGLEPETQSSILSRIRRGPPRTHWPRRANSDQVRNAKSYWTVRELKRIEIAGGSLPQSTQTWLESKIKEFPDIASMEVDEGFPEGPSVRWVSPQPDERYDTLSGAARLRALEIALSSDRRGWDDDPAGGANDWLSQPGKVDLTLADLEAEEAAGEAFPRLWNRFGWIHSPASQNEQLSERNLQGEADRVLNLLWKLSDRTIKGAIEGISHWLDSWKEQVVVSPNGWPVWRKIWPEAVAATNARKAEISDVELSVFGGTADEDREPLDLDTLNAPAGKLVSVFLEACPNLVEVPVPFPQGSTLHEIRGILVSATGRSGVIVKHRLIEALPYFLRADPDWTQTYLIGALLSDNSESFALWRAIARRTHHTPVLKIIGDAMVERAMDSRLGRETRGRLVFSLVVESLRSFSEGRKPVVSNSKVQQMLRALDDEVRASAANTVVQFIREVSAAKDQPSAAELFRAAILPFVRDVWPQERSLVSPGVSSALADLPASSGEAFAEAVETIERFLVPFDCWSMMDYGLYADRDENAGSFRNLSMIDSDAKAKALLRLLDLTVGSREGAVVPLDLTKALDQIQSVAPALAKDPMFRRLAASARR